MFLYEKPCNEKLIDALESIQYNATLTSKEKFHNKLGLEYIRDRRWMRIEFPN